MAQAPIPFASPIPVARAKLQDFRRFVGQTVDKNEAQKQRLTELKSLKSIAQAYGISKAAAESLSYDDLNAFVKRMEVERANETLQEQQALRQAQMAESQARTAGQLQAQEAARRSQDAFRAFSSRLSGMADSPQASGIRRKLETPMPEIPTSRTGIPAPSPERLYGAFAQTRSQLEDQLKLSETPLTHIGDANVFLSAYGKPSTPEEAALVYDHARKLEAARRDAQALHEEHERKKDLEAYKHSLDASPTAKDTGGADITNNAIHRALGKANAWTTGFGAYLKNVPGTEAMALDSLLDTIRANIGFDKLQAMRDASPTGGALGQVSEKELAFLQGVFGSLKQANSTEELEYNLKELRFTYNNLVHGKGQHPYKHPDGEQATGASATDDAELDAALETKRRQAAQRGIK